MPGEQTYRNNPYFALGQQLAQAMSGSRKRVNQGGAKPPMWSQKGEDSSSPYKTPWSPLNPNDHLKSPSWLLPPGQKPFVGDQMPYHFERHPQGYSQPQVPKQPEHQARPGKRQEKGTLSSRDRATQFMESGREPPPYMFPIMAPNNGGLSGKGTVPPGGAQPQGWLPPTEPPMDPNGPPAQDALPSAFPSEDDFLAFIMGLVSARLYGPIDLGNSGSARRKAGHSRGGRY